MADVHHDFFVALARRRSYRSFDTFGAQICVASQFFVQASFSATLGNFHHDFYAAPAARRAMIDLSMFFDVQRVRTA